MLLQVERLLYTTDFINRRNVILSARNCELAIRKFRSGYACWFSSRLVMNTKFVKVVWVLSLLFFLFLFLEM